MEEVKRTVDPMKTTDFLPVYSEAWATHEAFRRLGYPASAIFLHRNPDGVLMIALRHIDKQFAVSLGKVGKRWAKDWARFIDAVNEGKFSEEDLLEVWSTSAACREGASLLGHMALKGMPLSLYKEN
jgi:hypothetical protein